MISWNLNPSDSKVCLPRDRQNSCAAAGVIRADPFIGNSFEVLSIASATVSFCTRICNHREVIYKHPQRCVQYIRNLMNWALLRTKCAGRIFLPCVVGVIAGVGWRRTLFGFPGFGQFFFKWKYCPHLLQSPNKLTWNEHFPKIAVHFSRLNCPICASYSARISP